jgi:hypothetical protein
VVCSLSRQKPLDSGGNGKGLSSHLPYEDKGEMKLGLFQCPSERRVRHGSGLLNKWVMPVRQVWEDKRLKTHPQVRLISPICACTLSFSHTILCVSALFKTECSWLWIFILRAVTMSCCRLSAWLCSTLYYYFFKPRKCTLPRGTTLITNSRAFLL